MKTYKIHLHKEPEGGYTVLVPVLPGCITFGEDVDEAIAMATEAITLYIEELKERGENISDDSNILEYSSFETNRNWHKIMEGVVAIKPGIKKIICQTASAINFLFAGCSNYYNADKTFTKCKKNKTIRQKKSNDYE